MFTQQKVMWILPVICVTLHVNGNLRGGKYYEMQRRFLPLTDMKTMPREKKRKEGKHVTY